MAAEPKDPREALRNMGLWQTQCLSLIKRALRNPGVLQETVIDPGGPCEYAIEVLVKERVKLILPDEVDDDG